MYKKTLTILAVVALFVLAYFLYQHFYKENLGVEPPNPYTDLQITSETYQTENGFGYKIFIDGNLYVDQPTIPAVSGNRGFESITDAEQVANLAIRKIRQGIIPPTISIEELQNLGVN